MYNVITNKTTEQHEHSKGCEVEKPYTCERSERMAIDRKMIQPCFSHIKKGQVSIMCITKNELEQKVAELRSLKALKEETDNELKAMEREIIDYMTENGLDEEITDTAKITYKPQSRTTLDKAKLTEILGDDLKPFEKITTYSVLRIK